jgi:hypothetical protein
MKFSIRDPLLLAVIVANLLGKRGTHEPSE